MINGHGDDTYNFPNGIDYNFSSNVNPLGTSSMLIKHLTNSLSHIGVYPEPLATELAQRIEHKYNLPQQTVLISNGAVEAFYLLATLFEGKNSLIFTPTFSEYEDACLKSNHVLTYASHFNFCTVDYNKIDLVWLCNPNNPDGKIIDGKIIASVVRNNPETVFIIDEAYTDFAPTHQSIIDKIAEFDNLVVVRSMTKRYAITGLRLGFLVTNANRLKKIVNNLMPWRINSLSIQAGLFCLSDAYKDTFSASRLAERSKELQAAINQIEGFNVISSDTNYFLVACSISAAKLKNELALKHKILIRDASNFRGLGSNYIRIATQEPKANNFLIKVLSSITI